ncbi:MAG: hypothetical protein ACI88S_002037 [Ilumatobacter sp.]|jgi:hypothetical protein
MGKRCDPIREATRPAMTFDSRDRKWTTRVHPLDAIGMFQNDDATLGESVVTGLRSWPRVVSAFGWKPSRFSWSKRSTPKRVRTNSLLEALKALEALEALED